MYLFCDLTASAVALGCDGSTWFPASHSQSRPVFMTSVRGTRLLVVAGGSIKVPLDLLHVVIFFDLSVSKPNTTEKINILFICCCMASFDSQALCNWCYICLTYFQVHDSEGLLTEYKNTPPPLIHFKHCLRKTDNRNPLFACNCKLWLLKISLTMLPYLVWCAIAGYFMRLFEIKLVVKLTWINVIFRGKRFYNVPVASYGNKIKLPGPLPEWRPLCTEPQWLLWMEGS